MIAHCGINCDECPSYKGTISGDETLLVKMNEEFGDGKMDAIDFVCLGCKYADIKLIATDCARCAIRACAQAKGIDFCATCAEYPTCDTVKPYRGDGTSPRDKMNAFLRPSTFAQAVNGWLRSGPEKLLKTVKEPDRYTLTIIYNFGNLDI